MLAKLNRVHFKDWTFAIMDNQNQIIIDIMN